MIDPAPSTKPRSRHLPPALSYRAYRAYWFGLMGTASGSQIFQFSQIWLMHEMTGSPLYLGFLGLAQAIPSMSLNLIGGAIADKVNKRRLLAFTSSISTVLMLALATLTMLGHVNAWHVIIVAALIGAVHAFDYPTRMAIYPHLLDRPALTSAVALDGSVWWGTRIISPACAGLIVATAGTAVSMYVGSVGLAIAATVMFRLKLRRVVEVNPGSTRRKLGEGLTYVKRNPVVAFLLGMSLYTSFFGMSYMYLMPIFAVDILGVGSEGQGMLMSAGALGAILTSLWVGFKGGFRKRGPVLIGGATLMGLAVTAFGLTSEYFGSYSLALILMFAVGFFNSLYLISNTTSLQMLIPDQMRGRVMGIHTMSISMIPLSGMQAGAIASLLGAPMAVMIGGLMVIFFALGPALFNSRIRHLSSLIRQAEERA